MKISIIGLGKLGAPMAAVMAHKGHTVVGVDVNPAFVAAIQEGRAPVNEPGLAEMIQANRERLSATSDCEEAILATDVTFIIVPTPSCTRWQVFDALCAERGGEHRRRPEQKKEWHLVVLSSTVMPGSTGGTLAAGAGRRIPARSCGEDFGLCYNPEFIALGSVIRDMLNPDMILIGESDERSGRSAREPLRRRVRKQSAHPAHELRERGTDQALRQHLRDHQDFLRQHAGAGMRDAAGRGRRRGDRRIGCDTRIGQKYLKGALGYGGPCFPRDNVAFSALARANGVPALLAEATDQLNRRQVPRLAELILARLPEGGTVGVLGLSYKPDTEVIEESQGLAWRSICRLRSHGGATIRPPWKTPKPRLPVTSPFAGSAAECARQADVLAITTPWKEFGALRRRSETRPHRRWSWIAGACWTLPVSRIGPST